MVKAMMRDWLIVWIVFYAVSPIFQPYNGGMKQEEFKCHYLKYSEKNCNGYTLLFSKQITAAMVQWVRALDPQVEGCVFEYKPRQTLVVKTGNNSS